MRILPYAYFLGALMPLALGLLACETPPPVDRLSVLQDSLKHLRQSPQWDRDREQALQISIAGSYEASAEADSNRSQAAEALYQAASIYVTLPGQADRALGLYQHITEDYARQARAADALFRIGWLQANVLRDSVEAQVAFGLFLDRYPEHSLTPNVPVELQRLGLTPAEAREFARARLLQPLDSLLPDSLRAAPPETASQAAP